MNVANFTANVSYGFTDRFDIIAAWDVIQRVDRDNALLFNNDPERGSVDPRAPYASERWSGNKVGDLRVSSSARSACSARRPAARLAWPGA